jgi:hypothetical protein
MPTFKSGFFYFAMVFAAGFLLGTVRVLWLVPRLGNRMAELLETPIMLLVSLVAARWLVRKLAVPFKLSSRLGMGATALVLLLAAEFGFVVWLRGLTLSQYFATRDPVSGTAYYVALLLFALMPVFVARR